MIHDSLELSAEVNLVITDDLIHLPLMCRCYYYKVLAAFFDIGFV